MRDDGWTYEAAPSNGYMDGYIVQGTVAKDRVHCVGEVLIGFRGIVDQCV